DCQINMMCRRYNSQLRSTKLLFQLQKARLNFEKEAADKPGVVEQDVDQIIEDSREFLRR
ncbi:MAG: hypothetical protein AAF585_26235, partial [Verrucomicrobiota bacterium]